MGKPAENYWRIIASEQREPRPRDAVLKDIALALVTNHGAGNESRHCGGANPYDCRLGAARGDVWGQRRRA